MKPVKYTLFEFIKLDHVYYIPDFQRAYTWEENEVKDFIDSVLAAKIQEPLYIGTIYYSSDKNGKLIVTDGQQRMITVALIINALRVILASNPDYRNYLIKNEQPVLDIYEASPYFMDLYNADTISRIKDIKPQDSTKNLTILQLIENQKTIMDYLLQKESSGTDLSQIIDTSFINVELILIDTKQTNIYKIFKNINSKGIKLNDIDIIKNAFFSFIEDDNQLPFERQKKYKYWKTIETNMLFDKRTLDEAAKQPTIVKEKSTLISNLTLCIKWFATFKLDKNVAIPNTSFKLSREVENYLEENSVIALNILDELDKFSNSTKYVIYPTQNIPTPVRLKNNHFFTIALSELGIKQHIPVILTLYNKVIKDNIFQSKHDTNNINVFFEKAYLFHFFFNTISSDRPSKIGKMYDKLAISINRLNFDLQDFIMTLNANYPTKDEVKSRTNKVLFYVDKRKAHLEDEAYKEYKYSEGKAQIKHFIEYLEYLFKKEQYPLIIPESTNVETIEHIYNKGLDYSDLDNFKLMSFLPLEETLNGEAGNKSLAEKVNIYRSSTYETVKRFVTLYDSAVDKTDENIRKEWLTYLVDLLDNRFRSI